MGVEPFGRFFTSPEGVKQKSEQLKNIVKSLYSKGMNILQIAEITGINKDEVAAILN